MKRFQHSTIDSDTYKSLAFKYSPWVFLMRLNQEKHFGHIALITCSFHICILPTLSTFDKHHSDVLIFCFIKVSSNKLTLNN